MSFNFTPMSDEELNKPDDLVEDGIYSFEVLMSTRKPSKSGNPMAELDIKYWDKEGNPHTIKDWLVFSTVKFNIRKIKHFCESVGISEMFAKGELPENLTGYSGKLFLSSQKGGEIPVEKLKGKPVGSLYPDRNCVDDYVSAADPRPSALKPLPGKDEFSDDIPF